MSDTSSSSDDDDDLLSGGPTFTPRTRKSKANEAKIVNYLDDILEKEEVKTNRQKKIDDLIKKEEEEESEEEEGDDEDDKEVPEDTSDPEEEEDTDEMTNNVGLKVEADTNELSNPTAKAAIATTATLPSSPSSVPSPPKRRRTRQQTRVATKPPPLPPPPPPPQAVPTTKPNQTKKSPKPKQSPKTPTPTLQPKKKKKRKYDPNDPAYQARINSITHNAEANLRERDKRFKAIHDDVEGIPPSDGRMMGVEGDEDERQRLHDQANAIITGASSNLGVRRMFFPPIAGEEVVEEEDMRQFNPSTSAFSSYTKTLTAFSTTTQAMKELNTILTDWNTIPPRHWTNHTNDKENEHDGDGISDDRQRWEFMRTDVIQSLKQAVDADLLEEYLERRCWWCPPHTPVDPPPRASCTGSSSSTTTNRRNVAIVPKRLLTWLIRMSLSAKEEGVGLVDLSHGACRMASKVIEMRMSLVVFGGGDATNHSRTGGGGIDVDGLVDGGVEGRIFHVGGFVPMLRREFGLWTGFGVKSLPLDRRRNGMDMDDSGGGGGGDADATTDTVEELHFAYESSLKGALELWAVALDNDVVDWEKDGDDDGSWDGFVKKGEGGGDGGIFSSLGRTVAQNLAMLVRIGIDPSFHSGYLLLKARNSLILSFFHWLERRKHSKPTLSRSITPSASLDEDVIVSPPINKTNGSYSSLSSMSSIPEPYLNWIRHTADLSLKYCSDLSSGPPKSPDADDKEGWLPMVLAVRTCCQDIGDGNNSSSSSSSSGGDGGGGGTTNKSFHEAPIIFFAILATRVVRICSLTTRSSSITLQQQEEWERQVHRKSVSLCYHRRYGPSDEHGDGDGDDSNPQRQRQRQEDENIPLRYTFLATTELIFSQMYDNDNEQGREIKEVGPRFLTSVDAAALCTHMGMLLFQLAAERRATLLTTKTTSMALPETLSSDDTISEVDAMCLHLNSLVQMCPQLKKVRNVFGFPHLQRVKQLVGYLEKFYRYCGEVNASKYSGGSGRRYLGGRGSGSLGSSNGGRRKREGSLMSWVKVMDDDNRSKGDEEDSDGSSGESSVDG